MSEPLQNFLPDDSGPGDTRQLINIPVSIPSMPGVSAQTAMMPESENPLRYQDSFIDARNRLDANSNIGFAPHAIAVLAALGGNFGPAVQIMEQKRKTKLAQEFLPYSIDVHHKIKIGDIKGAQALLAEASGALGPRSPEIAARIDTLSKDLAEKQALLIDAKNLGDYIEANIHEVAVKRGTKPEDDPRWPALKAYQKILSRPNTPMSKEFVSKIMEDMSLKQQATEGGVFVGSQASGLGFNYPLQRFARVGDYPAWVIEKAAAALKLYPGELVSFMNSERTNQPFIVAGQDINTPENQSNVRALMTDLMRRQSDITLGRNVMIDPTMTVKLLQDLGNDVERFAMRAFGAYTPPDRASIALDTTGGTGVPGITPEANLAMARGQSDTPGSARIVVQQQPGVGQVVPQQPGVDLVRSWEDMLAERERIRLQTGQKYKTYVEEGYMQLVVDKNNYETPFAHPVRPLNTEEIDKAKGKVRVLPKEDAQKAISLYEAYRGLQYTDTLYKHLDNPTTIPQRLANWFDTTVARYTGYYGAKIGMAEIDRAMISRAVEAINNTEMRDDPSVGRVKEVLSGKLIDMKVSKPAVAQLLDRIRDKLAVYVGVENIPDIKETLKGAKVPGATPSDPYPGLRLNTGEERKALPGLR